MCYAHPLRRITDCVALTWTPFFPPYCAGFASTVAALFLTIFTCFLYTWEEHKWTFSALTDCLNILSFLCENLLLLTLEQFLQLDNIRLLVSFGGFPAWITISHAFNNFCTCVHRQTLKPIQFKASKTFQWLLECMKVPLVKLKPQLPKIGCFCYILLHISNIILCANNLSQIFIDSSLSSTMVHLLHKWESGFFWELLPWNCCKL